MKPNFTVAVIAKNEGKTLPRLLESLTDYQKQGGEILLLDTGSTDNTIQVAEEAGCIVQPVGDMFTFTIGEEEAKLMNQTFSDGEGDLVTPGQRVFDYSSARNYIASFSKTDMVAMPDCDEVYTRLDLAVINDHIEKGADQFEYNFVYAHDEEGGELIKFAHSKFYNRQKMQWVGIIHEVLQGEGNKIVLEENVIKLEHYQNVETNRSGYLTGLVVDCFKNPGNDRNSHYLGRELFYRGKFKSAIKELTRHVGMKRWPTEASESLIYMGDSYRALGNRDQAIWSYTKAFDLEPKRREPLMRLAEMYYQEGKADHVIAYVASALQIPLGNFYANNAAYYEYLPHEYMYWALWQKGEYNASKRHFDQCFAYKPSHSKYLTDYRWYYELPKLCFVKAPASADINYPAEKIIEEFSSNPEKVDWAVFIPEGYKLPADGIMTGYKQALDNSKYFMGFTDGTDGSCKAFMIHKKMIEKIENFSELLSLENTADLVWEKMKSLNQTMICGRARIIKSNT